LGRTTMFFKDGRLVLQATMEYWLSITPGFTL
jgi:hypothetical protein